DTFRHDLGVRLSEALVKEIERRTPYKVTGDPNADSTLFVRLRSENKVVLSETASDDPRALDATISAQANWVSRRGEKLMQNTIVPNSGTTIAFSQASRFVPEAGQSVDTALQDAIDKLAQRVVSQMELRW
ncbi:MAG: LPS assembly lipoprotein LptE, partial [Novipirellula sp. JB048]